MIKFPKKLFMIACACLMIPIGTYTAEAKDKGFRFACDGLVNCAWNTSYKDLTKAFSSRIIGKDADSIVVRQYNSGALSNAVYGFENDKLSSVVFFPRKDEGRKAEEILKDYINTKDFINRTYGKANVIETEEPADLEKNLKANASKLEKGQANFYSAWLVNDGKTAITHLIEKNKSYKNGSKTEPVLTHTVTVIDASRVEKELDKAEKESVNTKTVNKTSEKKSSC